MRLAEEYDAAQERGEIATRGGERSGKEHSVPLPTAADIGLSRKDIHEARQIRDAEAADPGVTERTLNTIIEIGKDLIAVKESLPHGSFLPWIEAEFGMSDQTARRFMDVGRVYGTKSNIVLDLTPTALYELAAPKTPLEVREEVEKIRKV